MDKDTLHKLYIREKRPVSDIARFFGCSQSRVNYWLKVHGIPKRGLSDAMYQKNNPAGDPFKDIKILSIEHAFLKGIGLGLYWGEGNKRNRYSVRLGNSDPKLIRKFIEFLSEIYGIEMKKLKFGLQLFNDSNPVESVTYWSKFLGIPLNQFQKPIKSEIRGQGTYKNKSRYGVLTLYFNNKKLRNLICGEIEKL